MEKSKTRRTLAEASLQGAVMGKELVATAGRREVLGEGPWVCSRRPRAREV